MHLWIPLAGIENGGHWPWPSRLFGQGVLHVPNMLLFYICSTSNKETDAPFSNELHFNRRNQCQGNTIVKENTSASIYRAENDYHISWNLETAICGFRIARSLWNLTVPPRHLSNFRSIRLIEHLMASRLPDITRFGIFRLENQAPVSISDKTCFRKISQSLEAAKFVFRIVQSLWNLTGTSAALLPMCLSSSKAMRWFKLPISRLRDFTRSYDKTSYWILKRDPGCRSASGQAA